MSEQIVTVPLYLPQPDYSVQVLAWPQDATIPSNATLNAVPTELSGKPVMYDFEQQIWVDKSGDVQNSAIVQLNEQIAFLTLQLASQQTSATTASAQ
ncbi:MULTISPECIES: hypothetical protein [Liquorilactobacillus]|uniref:hypothetical protein n=1 Tax=Liquorilactobacillus TaxID=2767888 RepID=UPI0039E983F0